MSERVTRKQKLRNNSLLENSKTVKGIFKKDDFDDTASTSDWGLLIEDHYKTRKRDRSVRLEKEPLTLPCQWSTCGEVYNKFDPYITHVKQHLEDYDYAEESTFSCEWLGCSYVAHSFANFGQHLCYHGYHTKLKSVGRNVEHRENLPKCIQAEPFVFPDVSDGYHCGWQYCHERFVILFDFFEHVRVHVYHNPRGQKEGIIKCLWRGCTNSASFVSQYKLTEHVRIHTKEKIIACPTCGYLFASKTKFCDHRRRQLPTDLQSYLCSQCSKYFPSERLLRDHMRLHINHYKCSMCEMTCPKPSILAKHIRYRHLNEKPYKCNQCTYRCVSKHNLDIHLKKHDPSNQYQCTECDHKCRSSYGLDRHYQKEHGKEWSNIYECHTCQKQFIRGGLLTKHLMKVHNYHWPSGHSRFHYKEDQDGIYRLQTVRYETIDVIEEIIKGKTVRAPPENESLKFNVLKRGRSETSVDTFDVVVASEDGSEPPPKKVLITIDDIDLKGNILKSRTLQSGEVICSDRDDIASSDDKILVFGSDKS